jgi:transcriptional regulator with XRE-family HTH domain
MAVTYCLMTTFSDWLTSQMLERKMSPAELSRLIKKDQSVVSRILNSERSPANETLEAIARALRLPPETVYRAAGLLPSQPEADEMVEKLNYKITQLTPGARALAEKLLDALLEEDGKKVVPLGKQVKNVR